MNRKHVSLIAVVIFIGLLYLTFRLMRFPAGLFCTAFVGGFVLWLSTTYRSRIDPATIVAPYLIIVILFIVHVYEEFSTHIEFVMTRLTGLNVSQKDFLTIAAFIAPVLWLAGLLMLLKRWHFGSFLMSVFFFGMMFGEPSHYVFPFILDGHFHYVSGMYTAELPSVAGWIGFFLIVREIRKAEKQRNTNSIGARRSTKSD
jgi:hypothetical protein